MASTRSRVVAGASSAARVAGRLRSASPANSLGYESPNEENHPTFFSAPDEQQRQSQQQQQNGNSRPARPTLLSRHSHMIAYGPPEPATPQANDSSLSGMVAKSEADIHTNGKKVSIKDRIACYQWTWFTMVSVVPAPLPREHWGLFD